MRVADSRKQLESNAKVRHGIDNPTRNTPNLQSIIAIKLQTSFIIEKINSFQGKEN